MRNFSTYLVTLLVCALGAPLPAMADNGPSAFIVDEATTLPSSNLEELAVVKAEFETEYEKLVAGVFDQLSALYAKVEAGADVSQYDQAADATSALDAEDLHQRIKERCQTEFSADNKIASIDCKLPFMFDFSYTHPVYKNVVVRIFKHSLADGAKGDPGMFGSRVSFLQANGDAEADRYRLRYDSSTYTTGYVATIEPPNFECQFTFEDPIMMWTSTEIEDAADEDVCTHTLSKAVEVFKRLQTN